MIHHPTDRQTRLRVNEDKKKKRALEERISGVRRKLKEHIKEQETAHELREFLHVGSADLKS